MLILGIVVGLLVLTFLVAIHELGHALAAKKNGVALKEYGIGFPPAVKSFKTKTDKILPKGTLVSLNWIPLGGFVRLKGEHDSDTGKGTYGAASFWAKTQILFAGVAMNWLVAIVIFTILALVGMPKLLENQFSLPFDTKTVSSTTIATNVVKDMPADKAGIRKDDQILSVNGDSLSEKTLAQIVAENKGNTIPVVVYSNGQEQTKWVQVPEKPSENSGYIGLSASGVTQKQYSTWSAPLVGVGLTAQFTGETFNGLGKLFANLFNGVAGKFSQSQETQQTANKELSEAGKSVAGPVAVVGQIFPMAVESGFTSVLLLAGLISISLACMNILPIPALDGGRWLMTLIFRKILKKPLTKEVEEKTNMYSMIFILALSVLIIVLDFIKVLK